MKLSDFRLVDKEKDKDKFEKLVLDFNRTESAYPSDKPVTEIFREIAAKYPEKTAVSDRCTRLTYAELDRRSDILAAFLAEKGVQPESPVGLLLDKSVETIVTVLGILKAGAAYLPLEPDLPLERMAFLVKDAGAVMLVSEKKYIRTLNHLLWKCPSLQAFLCADTDAVTTEKEPLSELMKKELWDYVGEKAHDDISGGGWVNSYTGENLSRNVMDEYGNNIFKKLSPYINKSTKVLEIACSSGISMFRLAPLAGRYYGTDLSASILDKTQEEVKKRGLDNVELTCMPAHEIDRLDEKGFDVIILNSVIQCFNGHNYLLDVLSKAIGLLNDKGILFAGDIMDLDRKEEMLASLHAFRREHAGRGYTTKTDWSSELFLSQRFFDDLRWHFPAITEVTHLEKLCTEESELSRFRYDTVIRVDKQGRNALLKPRSKQQWDGSHLKGDFSSVKLPRPTGRSLAYIMYTSGSTGRPKGVLIEHRSISRLVLNTNYIRISPDDRLTQTGPLSFDASTFEIWGALLNGASLYLVEKQALLSCESYGNMLKEEGITIAWLTAALFHMMVDYDPSVFSTLTTLLAGGEALSPAHVRKVREENPRLKVINGYGPTENTTFSACFVVKDGFDRSVPIGRPVSNSQCYVLDSHGSPQPVGVAGELCVSGDGLARGYLNDPQLTAARFIDHPFLPGRKLYKTGDQARWMHDGNLEYLGRLDHQVKIRGYRIEPGEVESVITQIPGIKQAVVIDRKDDWGDKYLCAYVTALAGTSPDSIRNELSLLLPAYMIPSFVMVLDQLPVTSNGKIDRKALPEPSGEDQSPDHDPSSFTATQKQLLSIWEELLGKSRISLRDNFFDLGGHSLKATRMVSLFYRESGIRLDLREVFANPTIEKLSAVIDRARLSSYIPIERLPEQEYYAVSHSQKRLWVLSQIQESSLAYHMPGSFLLRGRLNREAFGRAIHRLVERHESLRTVFTEIDGNLRQRILSPESTGFDMIFTDLSQDNDSRTKAVEMAREEAVFPFDLRKGPLLRAQLLKLEEQEYVFLFTMHHIISDGWSMEVLIKEMLAFYEAIDGGNDSPLRPLRIHYKDFVHWQSQQLEESMNLHKEYWLERFSGELPVLRLPLDRPRPRIQTFEGADISFVVPASVASLLRDTARRHDATLFMVLLTTVKAFLLKYTGQHDLILGTPVAGREHPDLEGQVGFYVNTLALRTLITPEDTFSSLLLKVKQVTLGAYAHQVYPFDMLLDELSLERDLGRSPLFDIMVSMQSSEVTARGIQGLKGMEVTPFLTGYGISLFDLAITFTDTSDQIGVKIEYNTGLLRHSTAEAMAAQLLNLLEQAAAQPSAEVSRLSLAGEADLHRILHEYNDTALPYPKDKSIWDMFEEQVQQTPDSAAVVSPEKTLVYRELYEQVSRLASVLRNTYGVRPGEKIGLLASRSADMITAIFSILRAGAAYVPVDASFPAARIHYMLEDSSCRLVLASDPEKSLLQALHGTYQVLEIGKALQEKAPGMQADDRPSPQSLAYVIFTSGSTGKPKGVKVQHGAVVSLCMGLRHTLSPHYSSPLNVALVSSLIFDASVESIFHALLSGHSLWIVPDEERQSGDGLGRYFSENRIDIAGITPAHMTLLSGAVPHLSRPLQVKHYLIGGEALSRTAVQDFYRLVRQNSGCLPLISNMYGPTECCVEATSYTLDPDELDDLLSIPIGKPLPNRAVYILDPYMQPQPENVYGEIYIGGEGLAEGYQNLPELTAQRFIPNPFGEGLLYKTGDTGRWLPGGNIEYLSRNDDQVKIRGYRIELIEIEQALLAHAQVKASVVLALKDDAQHNYLAAYLVADESLTDRQLREFLKETLPDYMIPARFIRIQHIPLTPGGKVDKRALPEPGKEEGESLPAHAGPSTPLEEELLSLWKQLLKRDRIGIHDNFFESGGHSIKAMQLVSQVHRLMGVRLELKQVFLHPTVAELADIITGAAPQRFVPIEPIPDQPSYALSYAQKRLWVLSRIDSGNIAYNMPGATLLKGPLDVSALICAFETVVDRHESLRTRFVEIHGEPRQQVVSREALGFRVQQSDISGHPSVKEEISRLLGTESARMFDLARGPLLHVSLVKTGDNAHLLLFTMHHIIGDGWSADVLVQEVFALYDAYRAGKSNPLPPLRIQYRDYAAWQDALLSGPVGHSQLEFWKSRLQEPLPVLSLLPDKPRPAFQSFRGDLVRFTIDSNRTAALKALAREHEATLFMVSVALVNVLLSKISGQNDIIVGSSVAGREHSDLHDQIGFYINTLSLRTVISEEETFASLLKKVNKTTLDAYAHQLYPFNRLLEEVAVPRSPGRNPLFDVMVEYHHAGVSTGKSIHFSGLEAERIELPRITSKLDLMMEFAEDGDSLRGEIEYSTDLFQRETIELLQQRFLALISQVAENSGQRISGLDLRLPFEKEKEERLKKVSTLDELF
jgi:amino acid adenylation domain-containing protein